MLNMDKNVNQLHSNLISANSLGWIRNWSAGWRQTFRVWSHSSPGLFLQSSVEAQRSIKMQKYNFRRFNNTNNKNLTEWSHSSAEKHTFFRLNIIFFAKTTELMSSGQWLWIIFSNLHAAGECFFWNHKWIFSVQINEFNQNSLQINLSKTNLLKAKFVKDFKAFFNNLIKKKTGSNSEHYAEREIRHSVQCLSDILKRRSRCPNHIGVHF